MKLRQTPGGTWCGTEKDYKAALKREGINPKDYTGREFVDVPTSKAELMEFLTFHNINCIAPKGATPVASQAHPLAPEPAADSRATTVPDLDAAFAAAPIKQQLRLAVAAIDAADARLN